MRSEMEGDILKVLVTEEQLRARVAEMGAALYDRFQGKTPHTVIIFTIDLFYHIPRYFSSKWAILLIKTLNFYKFFTLNTPYRVNF